MDEWPRKQGGPDPQRPVREKMLSSAHQIHSSPDFQARTGNYGQHLEFSPVTISNVPTKQRYDVRQRRKVAENRHCLWITVT
jgi:hypothetical protein